MTVIPSFGAVLSSPPPILTDTEAARLARLHYGLEGSLSRLTSERDLNFRLVTPAQGSFTMKLSNPAEPPLTTNFQTAALLYLQAQAPGLPVPRVIAALDGRFEIAQPEGVLRLLTYLPGLMLHSLPQRPARRQSVATTAAHLARGLQGFTHPAAGHVLEWDIKHALTLRPLLPIVADPDRRAQAARFLDRFAAEVAPRLPECRWQVVHNDLNPHNLLVDPADQNRISGILDFGDMVETPLICDLAIAAAYQIDPAAAVPSLAAMARAYHAVLPLAALEARLLPDLVIARMITTLLITAARAARYPENAHYILRNLATALQGLDALAALPAAAARATILQACDLE